MEIATKSPKGRKSTCRARFVKAWTGRDSRTPLRYDATNNIVTGAGKSMERMTTAEATVAALIAHGIDTIYALPGVHNDPLFDALFQAAARIRTIHTRHEQGAAYLALGAALATGKPQVYSVVPGPGLLNSAAALLTAYGMNAPVLALIGQIPQSAIGRGLGHLHEIRDQAGIIARLVDFSARIGAPTQAAPLVARALRAMRMGRPGPAVLE
ncbi:MAG: thiamine pyrophosphate-binding protein, partial [Burkholderiales bacterium]